ncbi:MAG: transposase [Hyphomicrobiales bacterium]
MPHKVNADRRGKFPTQKYRMTNWSDDAEALRRRGDLTFWISDEALSLWPAPRLTTRGGQRRYPNLAIEICLPLSAVYKRPLRQTRGSMRSIATLPDVEIAMPSFSTLSRKSKGLTFLSRRKNQPIRYILWWIVPA